MIDWNLGDILDAIEPAVPEDAPALIHHAAQLPEVIPQFVAQQRKTLMADTPKQGFKPSLLAGIGILLLAAPMLLSHPLHWISLVGGGLILLSLVAHHK